MENKKCFLDKLFTLFRTYGAKTLTMDDIAKEFSVSKKTLYKQYRNKEDLLHEVLEHISEEALEEVERVRKEYECPMEVMFVSGNRIDEVTCQEKNAFAIQLIKYYPEVFHAHQKSISVKISEIVMTNYQKGVSLEYFRVDIPIDMYIKFLINLLFSLDVSPLFEDIQDKGAVSNAMKVFYLDAIVTEKGKKRLNELKTKYE